MVYAHLCLQGYPHKDRGAKIAFYKWNWDIPSEFLKSEEFLGIRQ